MCDCNAHSAFGWCEQRRTRCICFCGWRCRDVLCARRYKHCRAGGARPAVARRAPLGHIRCNRVEAHAAARRRSMRSTVALGCDCAQSGSHGESRSAVHAEAHVLTAVRPAPQASNGACVHGQCASSKRPHRPPILHASDHRTCVRRSNLRACCIPDVWWRGRGTCWFHSITITCTAADNAGTNGMRL